MDTEIIRCALAEAETELQRLDAKVTELRAYQAERDKMHGVVAQLRFALNLPPYVPHSTVDPGTDPATTEAKAPTPTLTIADAIRTLLASPTGEEIRPAFMSVQEIVSSLNGLGFGLKGRSGLETVRAILNKKKDVFDKVEGRYRLK